MRNFCARQSSVCRSCFDLLSTSTTRTLHAASWSRRHPRLRKPSYVEQAVVQMMAIPKAVEAVKVDGAGAEAEDEGEEVPPLEEAG